MKGKGSVFVDVSLLSSPHSRKFMAFRQKSRVNKGSFISTSILCTLKKMPRTSARKINSLGHTLRFENWRLHFTSQNYQGYKNKIIPHESNFILNGDVCSWKRFNKYLHNRFRKVSRETAKAAGLWGMRPMPPPGLAAWTFDTSASSSRRNLSCCGMKGGMSVMWETQAGMTRMKVVLVITSSPCGFWKTKREWLHESYKKMVKTHWIFQLAMSWQIRFKKCTNSVVGTIICLPVCHFKTSFLANSTVISVNICAPWQLEW